LVDEILEIARDSSRDYVKKIGVAGKVTWVVDRELIARCGLRISALKWTAARMAPREYGNPALLKLRWRGNIRANNTLAVQCPPQRAMEQSNRMTNQTRGWSRRNLLATSIASTVSVTLLGRSGAEAAPATVQTNPRDPVNVTLKVNGRQHRLSFDVRTTLLDALREHMGLTGSKKGCDHGQCGACTVLVNDRRVLSCLTLAASADGQDVTTIEGLAQPDGSLHAMQQAFIDHDAFQCGYCTPGQILSAVACVKEGHAGVDAEIREYMSGNLCRCAAYPNIVDAIKQARPKMKEA
jgi:xanthine dehydrogenase YagT iron-sulfur-binding subunit